MPAMPIRISRRVGNWLLMARVYHPRTGLRANGSQLCFRCANAIYWTTQRKPLNQVVDAAFSFSLCLCGVQYLSGAGAISLEVSSVAATISRHVEYHEISYSRPRTVVLAHGHHLSRSCVHFRGGATHTGSAPISPLRCRCDNWRDEHLRQLRCSLHPDGRAAADWSLALG